MSCAIWEEQVALFAGGDLETAEAATVERHLSECAACSALAADLRSGLDGLREVHAEPLAAAHYAAVRGRVLAELAQPRRRSAGWAWAAALAVAAAGAWVVSLVVRPSTLPAPEVPRVVATAPTVQRPALREPGSNRSLTVAAPRLMGERRAWKSITAHAPGLAEAIVPGIDVPELAVAEVVTAPTPAPPAVEDSPVRMVQLATDDPNVVIYWLFEGTGDER